MCVEIETENELKETKKVVIVEKKTKSRPMYDKGVRVRSKESIIKRNQWIAMKLLKQEKIDARIAESREKYAGQPGRRNTQLLTLDESIMNLSDDDDDVFDSDEDEFEIMFRQDLKKQQKWKKFQDSQKRKLCNEVEYGSNEKTFNEDKNVYSKNRTGRSVDYESVGVSSSFNDRSNSSVRNSFRGESSGQNCDNRFRNDRMKRERNYKHDDGSSNSNYEPVGDFKRNAVPFSEKNFDMDRPNKLLNKPSIYDEQSDEYSLRKNESGNLTPDNRFGNDQNRHRRNFQHDGNSNPYFGSVSGFKGNEAQLSEKLNRGHFVKHEVFAKSSTLNNQSNDFTGNRLRGKLSSQTSVNRFDDNPMKRGRYSKLDDHSSNSRYEPVGDFKRKAVPSGREFDMGRPTKLLNKPSIYDDQSDDYLTGTSRCESFNDGYRKNESRGDFGERNSLYNSSRSGNNNEPRRQSNLPNSNESTYGRKFSDSSKIYNTFGEAKASIVQFEREHEKIDPRAQHGKPQESNTFDSVSSFLGKVLEENPMAIDMDL